MPTFVRRFGAADPPLDIKDFQDADLDRLLEPIDDLVERRNLVAHGTIDDIETVDLLNERCQFVAAFAKALYELLQLEMLRVEVASRHSHALGRPIDVFNDHIICFEAKGCKIAVGNLRNPLISRTAWFRGFLALIRGERRALRSHIEHRATFFSTIRSPELALRDRFIRKSSQRSANLQLHFGPRKNEGMAEVWGSYRCCNWRPARSISMEFSDPFGGRSHSASIT